ncbi:class I SAM-dependent methyltransferase [Candidatus Pacearchaeota archaeon]|nr:class I SAM-dependent methyltransferase [Candidatus Pacearchaeota archaeon]
MAEKEIMKGYNILAEEYYQSRKDKKGTSYFYNQLLEMPTTLKLLGNIRGKKVLDLGCGPGIYAKVLSEKGASVKGIDISEKSIEIAKKEAPHAEFIIGDAEKLPYKNFEFDIVLSPLMLGHLKSWNKVLSEIYRVLKKGGLFIFSYHNPVTEKNIKHNWFFKRFRELNGYFEEERIIKIWEKENKNFEMIHYHKTYSTIIKLLVAHRFEIIDYEDCKPLLESKESYPKDYKKTINYPTFCVWKVKKK